MRRKIRCIAWTDDYIDLPTRCDDFLSFWQDKISLVPDEFKDGAIIELEAEERYGAAVLECSISYFREETELEYQSRIAKDVDNKRRLEQRELDELARLKAKYEAT